MADADVIRKLARLSRLALTDEEVEKLKGDMGSILAYVDTIQKIDLPEKPSGSAYLDIENVMREDKDPHAPGIYTEALLSQAPRREGNHLKVKKIIEQ
ncbi:Asp-tRNA(Asn)/Glu-tRNA(Gln) amidotransferase subunit GatC [Candidatus Kaiserbacteria bacterium]|nr:Asp-tRNA(Asn)/Glu-tRNA(Gln) amidotransferase subunit GatC [Candidatus Kaiserbacteria bacterium]